MGSCECPYEYGFTPIADLDAKAGETDYDANGVHKDLVGFGADEFLRGKPFENPPYTHVILKGPIDFPWATHYPNVHVESHGGAITYVRDPENEYI